MRNQFWMRASSTALVSVLTLGSHPLAAQVLYGTLVGNVSDPGGQVVANAKVTATETSTGVVHSVVTNSDGDYEFHNLTPGVYSIRIDATGFANAETVGLQVGANLIVRADEKLSIAGSNTTVDVTTSISQLQTDTGTIHGQISEKQLQNLPIGGYNNYQSLINLTPGATPSRYQNAVMDTPSRSLTTNVNGASRTSNVTAVDGAAIQQVYLPHHTLYNPPTEDIQSVDIVTNSFTAEQGLAGGAAVSVLTKSGTNNFHGTLWELHTNSAMAARNYFYNKTYFSQAGNAPPKNILNQFGANLGGPILRNKLFFFSGFEGVAQRVLFPYITTVPTDAMRNGDFTGLATLYDPNTGTATGTGRSTFASQNADGSNTIPSVRISAPAQRMLALVPHANLAGTSNNYAVAGLDAIYRLSFDEKVNWQIDPKSSLFGKYSFLHAETTAPAALGTGGGTGLISGGGSGYSRSNAWIGGVGYTRIITPHLLFDANFGVGHNFVKVVGNDYGTSLGTSLGIPNAGSSDPAFGADPNATGVPSFAVTGFETFGHIDTWLTEIRDDYTYTYVANATWSRGNHTMRFGLQMLNNRMSQYQPQRGFGPVGGFTFTGGVTSLNGGASSNYANAFAQFLLGSPDSLGRSYQYENPIRAFEWQYGLYAQDQWQASRKLTLTYGLRWEYYPLFKRINGEGMERYDTTTNQVEIGGLGNNPSGGGTSASKLQFGPRFGFAYRLNDATVIRGGYGIGVDPYPFSRAMRDPYPITIAQTVNANNSYTAAGSLATGLPSYTTVAPSISNGFAQLPTSAYTKTLAPGTYRRGYIESYNLTVERNLPADFNMAVSYVGSLGVRQTTYLEINAGQTPGLGSAGQPLYQTFKRNAETQQITPFGTTHYDALQMSLKHPFKHGVLLTTAYTWSKSIDLNTDDDSTPLFNASAYQYRNRAVSDFDRRHVFNAGLTAELPFGKDHLWLHDRGVAGAILGGWKMNALISAYTGIPFTPIASATSLNAPNNTQVANQVKSNVTTLHGVGKFSTWFDTSAFAPVTTASFGTASRNELRGPGAADLDLGLSRTFPITERSKVELKGDAFNVTNTKQLANPANSVSSSSFGQITSTAGGPADARVLRVSARVSF